MPSTRDGVSAEGASLNDLFRCQAALNAALGRWQAQWNRLAPTHALSLQEVGLAVSFSRSAEGLYSATWGYPDSVDRCQGPTSLSVRVLMNCCS